MNKLVYIIVLNYNNADDTIECIKSLEKIEYDNYKIVIVDNKSTDDSIEKLKKAFDNKYYFIKSDKNIGYAAGNNLGVQYALENDAEYVCILNNDTIADKKFLKILIDYMENNHSCGLAGPAIMEYDNENIIQSTGWIINLKKGDVSTINNGINIKDAKDKVLECEYIGGACILARSELIRNIGTLPESYFLFYEETEWCYKAKKHGYKVMCILESKIFHKGSISINAISGLSEYLMNRNRIVFEKRNANLYELVYFYIYLILQTIYQIIILKQKPSKIKHYMDGIINKVDKRYSFIYLN